MKIGIYGQFYHEKSGIYIQQLLEALDKNNIEVVIEKNFLELIDLHDDIDKSYSHFSTFEELDHSYDLFFSIGGDGTILRTITYVRDLGIPIAGINTGRLGFLATIQKEEIKDTIDLILDKKYYISPRTIVTIDTVPPSNKFGVLNFAMNEIAVSRRNTTSMITVHTSLNDEFLNSYWADGLIVSSPTGSTGYSLSCGGPVMMPDAESMVLTPIAPHNLNARPLVIPDDKEVKLQVSGREDTYLVSLDSRIHTLPNETTVVIKKAPFKINMVVLEGDSFLKTLRKKMLWGEDKRN
ncbi:NAD kinase [Aquimarina sp. MMG015]|uniref:NAD kinase n=1 Tax=Aquimarina TaxID=290174 RepID=UPI000423BC95|nr:MULTISPECIES: NAD kinase [Aquimarina]AXT57858.1 NAD kinase [Aquimarina sp. AD1]MBQ4803199.1 NAD kinase [Aquimarina sp. MMG015]RKN34983.1 NAD kinase [Aquimarina sp. AD1]